MQIIDMQIIDNDAVIGQRGSEKSVHDKHQHILLSPPIVVIIQATKENQEKEKNELQSRRRPAGT